MKILALDSSAGPASCCISEEGRILAEARLNVGLTHSQTLVPMVWDMLKNAGLTLSDIGLMAVSAGPGSFTGIRIGVAAVKGLALPSELPCIGVSTLSAIAENAAGLPFSGIIAAAMDARCEQVYTSLFECRDGGLTRLSEDMAIPVTELETRLLALSQPVLLMGDGAEMCQASLHLPQPCMLAPPHIRFQNAAGVAAQAARLYAQGCAVPPEKLLPTYLRLPQAERERLKKLENANSL